VTVVMMVYTNLLKYAFITMNYIVLGVIFCIIL
jgi:hypothetical protein